MTRNQRSIVTNYFSRMSARIFEYLFSGSDEQTKGWRRPKGSGQEEVQGSQQVQGETEVCQLICSHVLESYHFSAGPGPGPGPGTDAVGPTLATETARGGVTGTRRGGRDWLETRKHWYSSNWSAAAFCSCIAHYMFCTQINVFFLSKTSGLSKDWSNILSQGISRERSHFIRLI